jgi:hypothetical protein
MKHISTKLLTLLLIFGLSVAAHAQKIPFQGRLYENGTAVNQPRNFVFSIAGTTWTETLNDVQISDGLYSVVLGAVTPLPGGLFDIEDTRTLNITLNGQSLTSAQIYAAMAKTLTNLELTKDIAAGDSVSGFTSTLRGTGVNSSSHYSALKGISYAAESYSFGVEAVSVRTTTTSTGLSAGLHAIVVPNATGSTNGLSQGVRSWVLEGDHGTSGIGVYGRSSNTNNSVGLGLFSNAGGFFQGELNPIINVGVAGRTIQSGSGSSNYGVWGETRGGGVRNVAIYGRAGTEATENWAGYFQGDVKITGNLILDNPLPINTNLSLTQNSSVSNDTIAGFSSSISGNGGLNSGTNHIGLRGISYANNTGRAIGVQGISNKNATSSNGWNVGVHGLVFPKQGGSTDGFSYGVRGETFNGDHGPSAVGVIGWTRNTNSTSDGIFGNSGGLFLANGNPSINMGVVGSAGGSLLGITTSTNYGVWGQALTTNSDKNIAIYGQTSGAVSENWAGYFQGDVKITGNLFVDGSGGSGGSISATKINQNYGNFGEKTWEEGLQGYLDLRGDAEAGKDNIRVALGVNKVGTEIVGSFDLFGPVYNDPNCPTCPRGFLTQRVAKGSGDNLYSGRISLNGPNSPNIYLEGQGWTDSDLPYLTMFGNEPNTNNNWWHPYIQLFVEKNNTDQQSGGLNLAGSQGNNNIKMGGKHWEANNGVNRGYVNVFGQQSNKMGSLEVFRGNDAVEFGQVFLANENGLTTFITPNRMELGLGKIKQFLDAEGEGRLELFSNTAGIGIRTYAKFDDNGDNTSHIALDGGSGKYIYLFGNGRINASDLISAPTVNATTVNATTVNVDTLQAGNHVYISSNIGSGGANTKNGGTINLGGTSQSSSIQLYGEFMDGNSNSLSHLALVGTSGNFVHLWGDGRIVATGAINTTGNMNANAFNTTSDARLKTNILPLNNALGNVMKMRGVSYNWIDTKKSDKLQIGVIAQEVVKSTLSLYIPTMRV